MIISFYLNILLGFLVFIKRGAEDISSDNVEDNEDTDDSEDYGETVAETKAKLEELKNNKTIERVENGLPVSTKNWIALQDIKQDYESYFDEESGNSLSEGMKQLEEYLDEELETPTSDPTASESESSSSNPPISESENSSYKPSVSENETTVSKPSTVSESEGSSFKSSVSENKPEEVNKTDNLEEQVAKKPRLEKDESDKDTESPKTEEKKSSEFLDELPDEMPSWLDDLD